MCGMPSNASLHATACGGLRPPRVAGANANSGVFGTGGGKRTWRKSSHPDPCLLCVI
jgi:hypothetical protein